MWFINTKPHWWEGWGTQATCETMSNIKSHLASWGVPTEPGLGEASEALTSDTALKREPKLSSQEKITL